MLLSRWYRRLEHGIWSNETFAIPQVVFASRGNAGDPAAGVAPCRVAQCHKRTLPTTVYRLCLKHEHDRVGWHLRDVNRGDLESGL